MPSSSTVLVGFWATFALPIIQWAGLALTVRTLRAANKANVIQQLAFLAFSVPFLPAWIFLGMTMRPVIERHPILYGLPASAWAMLCPVLIVIQLKAKLRD